MTWKQCVAVMVVLFVAGVMFETAFGILGGALMLVALATAAAIRHVRR